MCDLALATLLAEAFSDDGAVTPPIVQSSLFAFDSYESFAARMAGQSDAPIYTRVQNPTVAEFERLMARAEGVEAAVGFASGMAAISSVLLAFLRPGDRVACVENVYPDAFKFFELVARPFGIEVSYHPAAAFSDPDLLDGVKLAYLESPTSLLFAVMDLAKVAAHAKRHGTLTVIDNSWATPVLQRPAEAGIDIVLHSASKYISGHSDVVAGVVCGSAANMQAIRDLTLPLLGGKLAPFEAFLLVRGLRSLTARMRQHGETAALFVKRLGTLPCVRAIHAPDLGGRSGLLSVEFDDSVDIPALCDGLRHFRIGVSWGGYESLVMPAKAALAAGGAVNAARHFGHPEGLVRLSLGLEDAEDLWADFASAVSLAGGPG